MTNKKVNTPAKTLSPLHFEDLEPHRFEDLVRQLIYDLKEWQSIEATGRSGSDDGFDIRAWEKVSEFLNREDEENEESQVGYHLMEGHLWMVQCKREKTVGPTKVVDIINDGIDVNNPPYGYILVAPVSFSKKSYDAFRDTLRAKGVSEFYLWGKAELEDMLSLPKNDHVLFTFFGISLVVRRRSKSTERRFVVNNKNKLLRVLSDGAQDQDMYQSVLIRDIKDEHYPYEQSCRDFETNPRWQEHIAFAHHPLGLLFHVHKYYAFVDLEKKQYDITEAVDLVNRQSDHSEYKRPSTNDFEKRERVIDFWKHLPKKNQAMYQIDALLPYEDMLVIDDKGDGLNNFPHIFIDLAVQPAKYGMFSKGRNIISVGHQEIDLKEEEYTRVNLFPVTFPEIKYGKVYKDKFIDWDKETLRLFQLNGDVVTTLYDIEGKYDFLNVRDAILVQGGENRGEKSFIKITHKYKAIVETYLREQRGSFVRETIERQVNRKIEDQEELTVFEFERTYEWALKSYETS